MKRRSFPAAPARGVHARTPAILAAVRAPLVLAAALSLSGCGVMFGGTTKTISVNSRPTEARLTTEPLTGTFSTPAILELERKNSYTLVLWKEGYEETQFPITRRMRTGPLILDILFTGLLGVVVDHFTGGWWDLQPETVSVTLQPLQDGLEPIVVTISASESEDGALRVEADQPVRLRVLRD